MLQTAEPAGPQRPDCSDVSQALSESPPRAGQDKAAEPARSDAQQHRAALPRQMAQGPLVVAVDVAGHGAAVGACGRRGVRVGDNGDAVGCGKDLHDGQARRDQWQTVLGQGWLSRGIAVPSCAHLNPERLSDSTECAGEPRTR